MRKGFTLVEIIMVIAIVGVLMAIVLPLVFRQQEDALVRATEAELARISHALSEMVNQGTLRLPEGEDHGPRNEEEFDRGVRKDDGNSRIFEYFDPTSDKISRDPFWEVEESRLVPSSNDPNRKVYVDHWGNPYVYRYPGERGRRAPDIYSLGPTGIDEGGKGSNIKMDVRGF